MRTFYIDTRSGRHEVQANDAAGAREVFRVTEDSEPILHVIGVTEVVTVYTLAGRFKIDFTRTYEEGLLSADNEPETVGEAMRLIEDACAKGDHVIGTDGKPTLISARGIVALTYERVQGRTE